MLPSRIALARARPTTRIVSLGGDTTEILFALGAGDQLVGVDSTSTWPEAARTLPQVGYVRRLSAEGVLSLQPDLVLASAGAGPATTLDQIRAAGVTVVHLPQSLTPGDVTANIRRIGDVIGQAVEADLVAAGFEADMRALDTALDRMPGRPSVGFLLDVREGSALMAGRGTAADAVITLARCHNPFAAMHEGYKPVAAEGLLVAAPEHLVLMQSRLEAMGGPDGLTRQPALQSLRAVGQGQILAMDGLLLLGFGPRLPEAVRTLARYAHGADSLGGTGRT